MYIVCICSELPSHKSNNSCIFTIVQYYGWIANSMIRKDTQTVCKCVGLSTVWVQSHFASNQTSHAHAYKKFRFLLTCPLLLLLYMSVLLQANGHLSSRVLVPTSPTGKDFSVSFHFLDCLRSQHHTSAVFQFRIFAILFVVK